MFAKALQAAIKAGSKLQGTKTGQRLTSKAKDLGYKYTKNMAGGESMRLQAGDKSPGAYSWMSALSGAAGRINDGAGKATARFAASGTGKSFGHQVEQQAIGLGLRGGKNVLKFGAKAGLGGLKAARNIASGAFVGDMYQRGAGLAGSAIGTAANIVGSEEGAAAGKFIADDVGKVAKNFSDLAKNPIKPSNWIKLGESIATLPAKFIKLGESIVASNEKLAPFSGQIATATFNYKKDELERNIESAQRTGGSRAVLSDKISELKNTMQPLADQFTNFLNTTMSALSLHMGVILERITQIQEFTSTFFVVLSSMIPSVMKPALSTAADYLTFGLISSYKAAKMEAESKNDAIGPLNKMAENFVRFGGAWENQQFNSPTQTNNGTRSDGSAPNGVDPNAMLGNNGVDLK